MSGITAEATFALGAGIATFFAPCVYALLPGYVGYYVASVGGDTPPLSGVISRGIAATVGALVMFAGVSVLAVSAGEILQQGLGVIEPLVGVALIGLGLLVLWRGTLSLHVPLPARRTTVAGFGLFGAAYALAATACVLPLFLAVAVQSLTLSPAGTVLVLGSYAGGFSALLLAFTVMTAVGYEMISGRVTRHMDTLTRIAGVILVVAGFAQIYIALTYTY